MEELVAELNLAAARLARRSADEVRPSERPPRFVAGASGRPTAPPRCPGRQRSGVPQHRSSTSWRRPTARRRAALIEGGADLILIETVFDTLNAKAALYRGARDVRRTRRRTAHHGLRHHHRCLGPHAVGPDHRGVLEFDPPRAPDGGRPELRAGRQAAAALHRGAGPHRRHLRLRLSECRSAQRLRRIRRVARRDRRHACASSPRAASSTWSGGCCGTTPEHIARIARGGRGLPPRAVPAIAPRCRLSGLEPLTIDRDSLFVNVGERTNVTGSAKFRKLIEADDYDGALDSRPPAGRERRADHRRQHGRGHARFGRRRWCASST